MLSRKLKANLKTLLQVSAILTGVLLLDSCATQIHDEPLYGDMGANGAVEVHFLSSGKATIPKPAWDSLRFGMVCMPQSSFADFKKEIEELCSNTACTYEVTQAMKVFFSKIDEIRDSSGRSR